MGYIRHPNTNCRLCDKPIYKKKSQIIKNNGHVFCSTGCYGRFCRKDKVKDERMLKFRLLKARGPGCEVCGYSKIEILHVHHKDRNRQNNNLSNLLLLCPNCHYEEHYLRKSWLKDKTLHF